jgi:aryl-alcohol dehydrogenase-like predicted oxidoreductase
LDAETKFVNRSPFQRAAKTAWNNAQFTQLGSTGLKVCRIGIGGGHGVGSDDIAYAVSRGVNYIFYSSDLHPLAYERSRQAIRRYCRRESRRRDEIVLAACSYLCDAEKIYGAVGDQLTALHVDHVDVFQWGWVTRQNGPKELMRQTHEALCTAEYRHLIDELAGIARQVGDELRCRGYARFLGISTHDRRLAADLAQSPLVDVVMFRYNIAHRGAERDLFPSFPARRPGTVVFNSTHNAGSLALAPMSLPTGKYVPTYSDLYRFALDRTEIDVVLTGPQRREHIDGALEALHRAPMEPQLRTYLEKYGDLHCGRVNIVQG